MIVVHGLKNCDSCRKAMKKLAAAGVEARLNDISGGVDNLPTWLDALGAARLINKKSTTWRSLSEEQRALAESDPRRLLSDHPKLIKRPVIETPDGRIHASLEEAGIG